MIAIIKFVIENKVSLQNFSVLLPYLRAQPLIDPSDPYFAL